MKSLFFIIAALFVNLTTNGQKLFLIGESSYPCTDTIKLKSNSGYRDLHVFFAKDGKSGVIAVNIFAPGNDIFCGKLIIFLKDGNVITCNVSEASEKVDYIAKAMYKLTTDQLNKLKVSSIHTVKYSICGGLFGKTMDDYSASNKEIETTMLLSELFKE